MFDSIYRFGPDKCGTNDKIHFIFRHQNPITKEIEEKHLKAAPQSKSDKLTHLYTLVVRPDNSYMLMVDRSEVARGSLLLNFSPSVNPPKEINDPEDIKPSDWVDAKTCAFS
jgi:calnexin